MWRLIRTMSGTSDDAPWLRDVHLYGPFSEVVLLDATWQGAPAREDDNNGLWVVTDTPDLVYGGPPWPGVSIRLEAEPACTIRVTICGTRRLPTYRNIFSSTLIVDDHRLELETECTAVSVPVPSGNYPIDVWVDGDTPATTSHCVISLGQRSRRRLGRRRA